ncbi:zinc finger, CCHC-type containing protein [Tanacetum coccineum]
MGDANPIRTLGDYSRSSHEGYRKTIELPKGNNVVPLRSDNIRLVQNGCSFYELREKTRLRLFQFSLRDQASNWLERLPAGSISTWEDLTTRFLAQFFTPGRIDLLQKVPHHGIDLWLQVQILNDRINEALKKIIDYAAEGRLKKLSAEKAWATIEKLAQYEDERWNDPVIPEERSLDYENPDIEQLLGVMKYKVDALMKNAISLMIRSEGVFRMTRNELYQLPPEPSRQKEFEHNVMNFILDQEERVKQLEEYMKIIISEFMQLSSEVTRKLKKVRMRGAE